MNYFSYNVMYLRKMNNISQKEMACILGIGVGSLNKIENGILPKRLSVDVLFRIHERFGIYPSDVLGKKIVI